VFSVPVLSTLPISCDKTETSTWLGLVSIAVRPLSKEREMVPRSRLRGFIEPGGSTYKEVQQNLMGILLHSLKPKNDKWCYDGRSHKELIVDC